MAHFNTRIHALALGEPVECFSILDCLEERTGLGRAEEMVNGRAYLSQTLDRDEFAAQLAEHLAACRPDWADHLRLS